MNVYRNIYIYSLYVVYVLLIWYTSPLDHHTPQCCPNFAIFMPKNQMTIHDKRDKRFFLCK